MESQLGSPIFVLKYAQSLDGYDEADPAVVKAKNTSASEHLVTYIYLENSDQEKYGSWISGLKDQYSLGADQFSKTLSDATNVLSNRKFDNYKPKNRDKEQNKNNNNRNDDVSKLSFAQVKERCYCCGKPGHESPDCHHKDKKDKKDWWINKVDRQMHTQLTKAKETIGETPPDNESTNNSNNASKENQPTIGWAGTHIAKYKIAQSFLQGASMRDIILLDSDSSDTVFCNEKYVTNIHESGETLDLETNGGGLRSTKKCDVPYGIGRHWFNKNSITNIIGLSDMCDVCRVTLDSDKERAMIAHLPHRKLKFV